jgi:hypothetical protein
MAKFTKADEITVPQSVGYYTDGNPDASEVLQVFQPHQGRDLLYKNPNFHSGSTEISQSNDRRIPLGTYTLNNRDFWENNNFNESTFQSYLKDDLETLETVVLPTLDGDIVDRKSLLSNISPNFNYSIDALPFVINPNNDDIIHLDRYYDKNINGMVLDWQGNPIQTTYKEAYELAIEGKINYYLQPRIDGRLEQGNIDIFSERNRFTGGGGKNRFDFYISDDDRGYYLFKLNWGDGTEIEYKDEPKLLESTVLFEHFYEKPGFYSITGIVYVYDNSNIQNYEKFQTNILLNPSSNYELNLHDYSNFASIGGINKDSAFVKSLYNMVGINPLNQDPERASGEVIEKLNTLDKLQILNVLGKVDYSILNDSLLSIVSPYQGEIDGVNSTYLGCTNVSASNYNSNATVDDGSCVYVRTGTINIDIPFGLSFNTTIEVDVLGAGTEDQTLTFGDDTEVSFEFDVRTSISILLKNQLSASNDSYELSDSNDYFFDGWVFNTNDLIQPDEASPSRFREQMVGDIKNNFELTMQFSYVDDTPPLPPRSAEVHNTETDGSVPVGQILCVIRPSQSLDVNRYEVYRTYINLDQPTVVDLINTIHPAELDDPLNIVYNYYDEGPFEHRDYIYSIVTYDENDNETVTEMLNPNNSDNNTIRPIFDLSVEPNDVTGFSVQHIEGNILRFTWDQVNLYDVGIDNDFGHFELEIDNENGETYTYNYSGSFGDDTIIPSSFDFDASEIGSLFRYLGGGVINNNLQPSSNNVNPDEPLLWNARIKVYDGDVSGNNSSGWTYVNSIQPSRLIDPFGTVKLSIFVNEAHGTISVNDPDEIERWGVYTILLTPFLNHDIIVSSNLGWLFGNIEPYGPDDGFTDYIVYDENSNNQTISISELDTDKEGTLRVNWIELDEQSVISFPNNDSLVFDGYFVEPYVLGSPNEKVEIPFTWDLSLLYDSEYPENGHLAAGEELQVRLTYIYDGDAISPGYQALAQMFGGLESIITIDWDENNLSGTSTMVVNYVEDGDDLLESFVNFMGTTIYPEAHRLTFWKTNDAGMMSPFGTSGTLSGPTVYGSPEIQFNRATLGCTDNTASNYNPNASGSDGSCLY